MSASISMLIVKMKCQYYSSSHVVVVVIPLLDGSLKPKLKSPCKQIHLHVFFTKDALLTQKFIFVTHVMTQNFETLSCAAHF